MKLFLKSNVNIIDCCSENSVGEDSYKGVYIYNKTLTSSKATTQNCRYAEGTSYRRCIADLQNGPRWSDIDLKECLPKMETTQKLLTLNLVSFGIAMVYCL